MDCDPPIGPREHDSTIDSVEALPPFAQIRRACVKCVRSISSLNVEDEVLTTHLTRPRRHIPRR